MTGEMFENEFDLEGEINDIDFDLDREINDIDSNQDDGYLPNEYEPWFGEMLTELDSELLNEDLLLE